MGDHCAPTIDALALFPGAGSDSDHHTLVAVADRLTPVPVRRCDFAYRLEGRRAPDRAPKLLDAVRGAFDALRDQGHERIVLGGRSMGGRMCSMAAADGLAVAGLVLLSYPLHPPGRPEKLRTDHFDGIHVPCLFISGTRDRFGTPHELTDAVVSIDAPIEIAWLEGEGHDPEGCDDDIVEIIAAWLEGL